MKYRIIGADGKPYGPADLDQVRRWLVEGRAESRTQVYVEGASNWTYLGLLPELSAHFASQPPAIPAAQTGSPKSGTNRFAMMGLICGLLSWMCCCCGCPFGLLGTVFSILALVQLTAQPEPRQEGRTMAVIGLVLSGTNLLFGIGAGLFQIFLNPGTMNWQFNSFQ